MIILLEKWLGIQYKNLELAQWWYLWLEVCWVMLELPVFKNNHLVFTILKWSIVPVRHMLGMSWTFLKVETVRQRSPSYTFHRGGTCWCCPWCWTVGECGPPPPQRLCCTSSKYVEQTTGFFTFFLHSPANQNTSYVYHFFQFIN